MTAYFETLTDLGNHLKGTNIEVVDPGIDLVDWADALHFGPAWKNQPSIRKVVGFVARHLASTPLHVYEMAAADDRRRVRDGDLAKLLRRPSRAPSVTPYRFWESLLIDGLINDKWCARIVHHEDGYELVRIPARLVTFKSDFLGRIEKVNIRRSDGSTKEEDPADFLIDVGYSERGANGTSPLKTLQHILAEYDEAIAYRRSIWANGARVPLVLTRPAGAKWGEGAFERFKASWAAFVKGGGKEGGTPILEDGMTPHELNAFRPRDTLDLEGRKLTDIEVSSAYFIAPELIGAREGTFANIKAFRQMLYGPNLGPYFDAWQQALNLTLVPLIAPGKDVYIEANIESKMRGSFEEQADYLSTATGAPYMLRSEARSRLNLPAIEGAEQLVTPLNVLMGGQSSPQDGVTAGGGGGSVVPKSADDIQRLITAATALIRAGFDPQASLAAVGLDAIEHLGLLPVTVRDDEKALGEVLARFSERQRQVVASQKSAGAHDWWDRGRWDRELTDDLVKAGVDRLQAAAMSRLVNDEAEAKYLEEGSAR